MADEPKEPPPPIVVGSLTPEQKTLVNNWFKKRVGEGHAPQCSICGHSEWSILEHLVSPLVYSGGGIIVGGAQYPHFMLGCNHCGNIQFINAILSGVIKLPAPEK